MVNLRIAVFGDVHGQQDSMYRVALDDEERTGLPIDLILQVGDFETIRREEDFQHYYAPKRYHRISDISDYCSGIKSAPFFTLFIGGNHEAWGVLEPHATGGFICPNVYYLGRSGVLDYKGIKIAGLSGLFSSGKYKKQHLPEISRERQFYREEDVKSLLEQDRADILLLHEWIKPYSAITPAVEVNILPGIKDEHASSPSLELVRKLKPAYVFMGHLHRTFMEGSIGDSKVVGLPRFEEGNENSYRVVTLSTNE